MSKELPYFKFEPNQWLTGDITLESMEVQGIFINVCALYWSKDCRVAIAGLQQRYGGAIVRLLESGILKEKEGFAVIEFLDEQWVELSCRHQKNVENGRMGGFKSSLAKATPKHLEEKRREEIRIDNTLDAPTQRVVTRPTIDEVKAYCIERKNQVDADKWFDHYTSNGWLVGKNKMRDWKAAVRTWERSQFTQTTSLQQKPVRVDKAAPALYKPS